MMRRHILSLALVACGLAGCSDSTAPSNPLAGTYSATVFRVTPAGESEIDVLAAGGTLTITIAANNSTTGSLDIPASVGGGISASMAGTATLSGSTVTFQQSADTFVRDLSWTRAGSALTVTGQQVGNASFTITLTRQ
jgi:hypothetical protein